MLLQPCYHQNCHCQHARQLKWMVVALALLGVLAQCHYVHKHKLLLFFFFSGIMYHITTIVCVWLSLEITELELVIVEPLSQPQGTVLMMLNVLIAISDEVTVLSVTIPQFAFCIRPLPVLLLVVVLLLWSNASLASILQFLSQDNKPSLILILICA